MPVEDPWTLVEWKRFLENRAEYPLDDLMQYAGKHIAWNFDGTGIVACASDIMALEERLRELGVDPRRVVFSYIDPL